MNNIEYQQGIEHNYLVLNGRELIESYQTKMLAQNKISGFLELDIHYVDGAVKYYYRIDSKQSLTNLFEKAQMSCRHVTMILKQLQLLIQRSREYLLEEKFFCIEPEFLYIDEVKNEIALLFYPEKNQSQKEDFLKLAEFFLQHIDHKDEEAVLLAYQFYKIVLQENFVMNDIMCLLQTQEKKEEDNYELLEYKSEETDESEIKVKIASPKSKNQLLLLGAGVLLIVCGIIGIYRIPVWYEIGIAFMGMGAVSVACYVIYKINHNRRRKSKISSQEKREEPEYEGGTVLLNTHAVIEERILTGKIKGKEMVFSLEHLPITIGKEAAENEIVISDRAVSRKHAYIEEVEGNLYLEDLESTNGTYKNGIRLEKNEKVRLEAGDELRFANITFIYT